MSGELYFKDNYYSDYTRQATSRHVDQSTDYSDQKKYVDTAREDVHYPHSKTETGINIAAIKSHLSSQTHNKETFHREKLHILCIDLTQRSSLTQFLILSLGVFVFYLLYGYYLEYIFQTKELQSHSWYVTCIQFGLYSLFGFLELYTRSNVERRIPIRDYLFLAFLTVSTMGLSNTSLAYLNYPTQVIFKSCKLIPVLIGGILIQGKKYGFVDFLSCLFMSAGLAWFVLANSKITPNFNFLGIVIISLALCADAVIGNVQEKTMKAHSACSAEMVLYSYAIGFSYLLFGTMVTGEFITATIFCIKSPLSTYAPIFVLSLTGYLGVNIVMNLVKLFGALKAVTVTTTRKAVSIIVSFVFFSKPFTSQYIWSGLLVVLGIYLNVYQKSSHRGTSFAQALRGCLNMLRTKLLRKKISALDTEMIV